MTDHRGSEDRLPALPLAAIVVASPVVPVFVFLAGMAMFGAGRGSAPDPEAWDVAVRLGGFGSIVAAAFALCIGVPLALLYLRPSSAGYLRWGATGVLAGAVGGVLLGASAGFLAGPLLGSDTTRLTMTLAAISAGGGLVSALFARWSAAMLLREPQG